MDVIKVHYCALLIILSICKTFSNNVITKEKADYIVSGVYFKNTEQNGICMIANLKYEILITKKKYVWKSFIEHAKYATSLLKCIFQNLIIALREKLWCIKEPILLEVFVIKTSCHYFGSNIHTPLPNFPSPKKFRSVKRRHSIRYIATSKHDNNLIISDLMYFWCRLS